MNVVDVFLWGMRFLCVVFGRRRSCVCLCRLFASWLMEDTQQTRSCSVWFVCVLLLLGVDSKQIQVCPVRLFPPFRCIEAFLHHEINHITGQIPSSVTRGARLSCRQREFISYRLLLGRHTRSTATRFKSTGYCRRREGYKF